MILRFKEGSALYAELVRMFDIREKTYVEACDIIDELVGERPTSLGYMWGFDNTCMWSPYMVSFRAGFVPDPKLMVVNKEKSDRELTAYKVRRNIKKSREASDKFRKFHNTLTSDGLEKLGLPMHAQSRYFYFMPCRDEKGYYLSVSNSVMDVLKKNDDIIIELQD